MDAAKRRVGLAPVLTPAMSALPLRTEPFYLGRPRYQRGSDKTDSPARSPAVAAASVITLTVPHPASPVDHEGKVAVSAATLAHECGGRERVLDPACGCRTAIFRAEPGRLG